MENNLKYPEDKNIKKTFTVGALAILLTASFLMPIEPESNENQKILAEKKLEEPAVFLSPDPFENIELVAKSAFVWDIKNQKVIFEKNPDQIMPIASITKMFTAIMALDLLPPETEIKIEKKFLEAEGDTGLYVDEKWTLKDLLDFSLLVSSNDGTRAIASVAGAIYSGVDNFELGRIEFINQLNQKLKTIGLYNTDIKDESGLDKDEEQSGAYSTAREVATAFEYIFLNYAEILEPTAKKDAIFNSLSQIEHSAKNTNLIVYQIPGIIGSKTGSTDLAGGNLATIFDAGLNHPIITVVLGSTINGRFVDTEKLISATKNYLVQTK